MNAEDREALEKAGFRIGDAEDFVGPVNPADQRSGVRPEVAELITRVINENRSLWERLAKT